MKNYSRARAGKGKTVYRTPSVFRYQKAKKINKIKNINQKIEPVKVFLKKF